MSIRNVVSTLTLAACTLAPLSSHAASLFGHGASTDTATAASTVKVKMVKFTLKNRTSAPMTLLVNDQSVTIAANAEMPVRAASGSDIFTEDRSTVKVHVTDDLSGNTVSFR